MTTIGTTLITIALILIDTTSITRTSTTRISITVATMTTSTLVACSPSWGTASEEGHRRYPLCLGAGLSARAEPQNHADEARAACVHILSPAMATDHPEFERQLYDRCVALQMKVTWVLKVEDYQVERSAVASTGEKE
jgi:hypothetical protein